MKNKNSAKMFLAAIAISISGFAYAHSGAEGVVKDRMDMMGEIARSMKVIGKMIKGEVEYDAPAAKAAALEIFGHLSHMTEMFPEGSTEKPSEALPAIWENWDEFATLSDKLKTDAKQLAEVAESTSNADAIKAQFGLVGKSCGSCHEKFRLKK